MLTEVFQNIMMFATYSRNLVVQSISMFLSNIFGLLWPVIFTHSLMQPTNKSLLIKRTCCPTLIFECSPCPPFLFKCLQGIATLLESPGPFVQDHPTIHEPWGCTDTKPWHSNQLDLWISHDFAIWSLPPDHQTTGAAFSTQKQSHLQSTALHIGTILWGNRGTKLFFYQWQTTNTFRQPEGSSCQAHILSSKIHPLTSNSKVMLSTDVSWLKSKELEMLVWGFVASTWTT